MEKKREKNGAVKEERNEKREKEALFHGFDYTIIKHNFCKITKKKGA